MANGKQIGCLAGLALTAAVSLFLDFSVDLLFHPWFHGMPGTFSPAGGWVASFEVPGTGRHYLIHLALSHEVDHSPQGGVSSALEGSADVCMLGGQPVEFPMPSTVLRTG
jgi:hypothetical protein